MSIKDVSTGGKFEIHAEDSEGNLIGWIFGYIFGRILTVGRVDVVPQARRQGLGSELWRRFAAPGRQNGATGLTGQFCPDDGHDEDLDVFYERLGVEIDETGRLHQDL